MSRQNRRVTSSTTQEKPMPTTDPHKDLDTVKQLAKRLNVKPSWVYTATAAGRIPVVKIGKYNSNEPWAVLEQLKSKP